MTDAIIGRLLFFPIKSIPDMALDRFGEDR